MQIKIIIETLNEQGEGIGKDGGRTYIVPFALPEEEVEIIYATPVKDDLWRAERYEICTEFPQRTQPPCPYFGTCGGCQLQHLKDDFYKDFKKDLLLAAIGKSSGEARKLAPIQTFSSGMRRRINFKVQKANDSVLLGYHQRRSHKILDIITCPLLTQRLQHIIAPLKAIFCKILTVGEHLNVFLTDAENGIDMMLGFEEEKDFSSAHISALTNMAKKEDIIRITVQTPQGNRLIYMAELPIIAFNNVPIAIPPYPFLQPSVCSQNFMIQKVLQWVPKHAKKIADLFSGIGTFSFPMAQYIRVDAYEYSAEAIDTLKKNKRHATHELHAFKRDLFRQPLSAVELNVYDAIVIDPPRAGAAAQMKQLAQSSVPNIMVISCNKNTFARDMKILEKGGYTVESIQALDQFLWSPHLEIMASFRQTTNN